MKTSPNKRLDPRRLSQRIAATVAAAPVRDIHTHLYDPAFGKLLLWGIDDLLTYHYLVAEAFRQLDLPYENFWELEKSQQAELVWRSLFLGRAPISEAARGVITTLNRLGLDARQGDLPSIRRWFKDWKPADYVDHCLNLANVQSVCMTNSPFDADERKIWETGFHRHPRFESGLRLDPLLLSWKSSFREIQSSGYKVKSTLTKETILELRRFLRDWTTRINPNYAMVSLPPSFCYPTDSITSQLLEKVVLPHCSEFGLPFAMMVGVRRAVNPELGLAGDGLGLSNLRGLENLCQQYPDQKFLVTLLARENQHELCVLARKFRNLHLFGCWWFTNIPSIIQEMTTMRLELLGFSFTAQHSDARVVDQLIYKWDHSREVITNVLQQSYCRLASSGWEPSDDELKRDVGLLLGGSFDDFCRIHPAKQIIETRHR